MRACGHCVALIAPPPACREVYRGFHTGTKEDVAIKFEVRLHASFFRWSNTQENRWFSIRRHCRTSRSSCGMRLDQLDMARFAVSQPWNLRLAG